MGITNCDLPFLGHGERGYRNGRMGMRELFECEGDGRGMVIVWTNVMDGKVIREKGDKDMKG
jgi:hypothetical protein